MKPKVQNHAVPVGHEDWEVRDALETIMRADKIRANKALMKKVRALAQQRADALRQLSAPQQKK